MRFLALISFCTFICHQASSQAVITKQQIVASIINRWWVYEKGNKEYTTYMRCSDRECVKRRAYGGFIFRGDGNFEEILRVSCASGRGKPYAGKWVIANDTIRVKTNDKRILLFKIVEIGDNTFTDLNIPPIDAPN